MRDTLCSDGFPTAPYKRGWEDGNHRCGQSFGAIGVDQSRNRPPRMKTSEQIESSLLCDLTADEIAHVSLGLGHSFGAVLSGMPGDRVMYLRDEYAPPVAIDAKTLTVSDVWRSAEVLS
jgi:hypothetical protein